MNGLKIFLPLLLACMLFRFISLPLLLQVYTLGTILSMQISFVGFQPVQSSEHMAVSYEHVAVVPQSMEANAILN